ncbi:Hypothetical predicted protein [Pelobates cultripes]|uniref:Uncharacterized protein n=1 Tax=Pelobates cultripes TaxID=61616 RepID=A0AAD1R9H1_PELCU|nr:Hypothetical predicted protein [Pelobates cultripes]
MKDGVITMQCNQLPGDLLPEQHAPKMITSKKPSEEFKFFFIPKKLSSYPEARILSTSSIKKTRNWLAHKPSVELVLDPEREDIDIKTQNILDKANHYNQMLEVFFRQEDLLELRRKEIQHKRWSDNVAEPLKKIIARHVDGESNEDLEWRRQFLLEQYEEYLKYCNSKGRVLMRDYNSMEYNPFLYQFRKKYLRVSTPSFRDPLLFQILRRIEDDRINLYCETGRIHSAKEINALNLPRVPFGRQHVSCKDWLETPLTYIESEIRQKSRRRMRGTFNKVTMDFKAWN